MKNKKTIIHYNRIIDVSGEYVLYIQDNKDTLSDTKLWMYGLANEASI